MLLGQYICTMSLLAKIYDIIVYKVLWVMKIEDFKADDQDTIKEKRKQHEEEYIKKCFLC